MNRLVSNRLENKLSALRHYNHSLYQLRFGCHYQIVKKLHGNYIPPKDKFSISFLENIQKNFIQESDFKFSNLEFTENQNPKTPSFTPENLAFGKQNTNYMLKIEFHKHKWSKPQIVPFQNFSLDPFNTAIHYSLTCYEGMKAYYCETDGKLRMFRPWDNMARFKDSMERLCMDAPWNENELMDCIAELIRIEQKWIPRGFGQSLYVRPWAFSLTNNLELEAPSSYGIFCILNPAGNYFGDKLKPINIKLMSDFCRGRPKGS